ncbi:ATP-binding protein [Candidatus Woesearchaeota archaeon]|nr:ATP-binding protein [Candidatus Woesearchaeota archaeon]
MVKGQVVSGDFGKIVARVKAGEKLELGELVVIEGKEKFILQVYDLTYGSQISPQNLELVSGMSLEEGTGNLMDSELRNYNLAFLKPMLVVEGDDCRMCKDLPNFFSKVREFRKEDLSFITTPKKPFHLGKLRSGSKILDVGIFLPGDKVFSEHVGVFSSTGKGKSNLMSCILWDVLDKDFCGMLVLDPHDEYYGRSGLGLKDHPKKDKLVYYSVNPVVGGKSLKINLKDLKPEHFQGAIALSDPQQQLLYLAHRKFGPEWVKAILEEKEIGVKFNEDTVAVVKRKLINLLNVELVSGQLYCQGIFDQTAGENTVKDICRELEDGKIVVMDTSSFSGAIEILIGSLVAGEIFHKYKFYKNQGTLDEKPVISIVLEEAPRVLGKKVLEHGSNVFESIAREGRKFKVGLTAITQIPSDIPKNILANMNTKIILGLEMGLERQAVIESSPQDLSTDNRNIASLDKGEAIVTSIFTKFAVPVKIPLFKDFAAESEVADDVEMDFGGVVS